MDLEGGRESVVDLEGGKESVVLLGCGGSGFAVVLERGGSEGIADEVLGRLGRGEVGLEGGEWGGRFSAGGSVDILGGRRDIGTCERRREDALVQSSSRDFRMRKVKRSQTFPPLIIGISQVNHHSRCRYGEVFPQSSFAFSELVVKKPGQWPAKQLRSQSDLFSILAGICIQ